MDLQRITKRCPIDMDFLKKVSTDSKSLARFERVRLRPSRNAAAAGEDVAGKVVDLLESCPVYHCRAVHSGSQARGVRLKRPAWGDVDVVCFLLADARDNRPVDSFDKFERFRYAASKRIKEWLEAELLVKEYFDEQAVVEYHPGFTIKLRVKRNSVAHNPWFVDIIFACDLILSNNNNDPPQWNAVQRQIDALSPAKQKLQTSSMAPYRDDFLKGLYAKHPRAKPLVRVLKAFNCISTKEDDDDDDANAPTPRDHCVSGFVVEMLALSIIENDLIPKNFDLSKAMATCLFALAFPDRVAPLFFHRQMAGGDASDRPAPPNQQEIDALRKSAAGAKCLVLVDPFAPFSNVAAPRKKTADASRRLRQNAARFHQFLESQNVSPYEF